MTGAAICIALHKPYWVPSDNQYLPVQVGTGADINMPNIVRDSSGVSIAELNSHYSELTAQYWAWKNLHSDYYGLVHYRRHFAGSGERGTLSALDLKRLLLNAPVVLPKKTNYYIETLESHYDHTFSRCDLQALREAVCATGDEYGAELNHHLRQRSGHMYNMHVMRSDVFSAYCEWLYPVLARINQTIDFTNKTPFEARCIGRLSEFLPDVWLHTNSIPYTEQPLVNLDRTSWTRKGSAFLSAKLFHKKYEASL